MSVRVTPLDDGGSIEEHTSEDGVFCFRRYLDHRDRFHRVDGPAYEIKTWHAWYRHGVRHGPSIGSILDGTKRIWYDHHGVDQPFNQPLITRVLVRACKATRRRREQRLAILTHWLISDLAREVMLCL